MGKRDLWASMFRPIGKDEGVLALDKLLDGWNSVRPMRRPYHRPRMEALAYQFDAMPDEFRLIWAGLKNQFREVKP
jgi:hypothetical protein